MLGIRPHEIMTKSLIKLLRQREQKQKLWEMEQGLTRISLTKQEGDTHAILITLIPGPENQRAPLPIGGPFPKGPQTSFSLRGDAEGTIDKWPLASNTQQTPEA